jgi:hypothetical protein
MRWGWISTRGRSMTLGPWTGRQRARRRRGFCWLAVWSRGGSSRVEPSRRRTGLARATPVVLYKGMGLEGPPRPRHARRCEPLPPSPPSMCGGAVLGRPAGCPNAVQPEPQPSAGPSYGGASPIARRPFRARHRPYMVCARLGGHSFHPFGLDRIVSCSALGRAFSRRRREPRKRHLGVAQPLLSGRVGDLSSSATRVCGEPPAT